MSSISRQEIDDTLVYVMKNLGLEFLSEINTALLAYAFGEILVGCSVPEERLTDGDIVEHVARGVEYRRKMLNMARQPN